MELSSWKNENQIVEKIFAIVVVIALLVPTRLVGMVDEIMDLIDGLFT